MPTLSTRFAVSCCAHATKRGTLLATSGVMLSLLAAMKSVSRNRISSAGCPTLVTLTSASPQRPTFAISTAASNTCSADSVAPAGADGSAPAAPMSLLSAASSALSSCRYEFVALAWRVALSCTARTMGLYLAASCSFCRRKSSFCAACALSTASAMPCIDGSDDSLGSWMPSLSAALAIMVVTRSAALPAWCLRLADSACATVIDAASVMAPVKPASTSLLIAGAPSAPATPPVAAGMLAKMDEATCFADASPAAAAADCWARRVPRASLAERSRFTVAASSARSAAANERCCSSSAACTARGSRLDLVVVWPPVVDVICVKPGVAAGAAGVGALSRPKRFTRSLVDPLAAAGDEADGADAGDADACWGAASATLLAPCSRARSSEKRFTPDATRATMAISLRAAVAPSAFTLR
mmetsp:Transcript_30340/g.93646  ORF Transcript_30340/g.93646 Transcript_30340/m.93646 type:complete len:415 (-) Transcript_30340:1022-2266(-)